MLDMRGPRNAGEQRQNPKFISPMNTLPSKSIGQLFSKMKSTIKKFQEEALPQREREIRMAIEMRFNKSRANKEYIYGDGDSSPIDSDHSSDIDEFRHLKEVKYFNLHDQNKKHKKQVIEKADSIKNGMKKFKINNNRNGLIRKTEGDEMEPKRVLSNQRTLSNGNDSPVNLGSKYLFKGKNHKHKDKRRVNLSEEAEKYRTLGPYLEKSKQYVRYAHKIVRSKQPISRDSSASSDNSNMLKSNLTLQVQFKKKYNGQNTSMHYKNISSSTRIVPKAQQDKSRQRISSTSSGKIPKNNDKLLKFLFSTKKF